jgi:hypothetical protein
MLRKIEIESNFLIDSLEGRDSLHFLGPDGETSLYLNVKNLEDYHGIDFTFWIELLITDYAPIIIFYIQLKENEELSKFSFIYNLKDEEDLDELNDMINYEEAILNFVQFEDEKLFFGFSYLLSFGQQFIEEFERIILEANRIAREIDYSFKNAMIIFNQNQAIFKQRTKISSDMEFFIPQVEQEIEETNEKDNDFDYETESGLLKVKTYKRSVYEKIQKNPESKEFIDENLENKVLTLETIIKEKNRDINRLKKENRYLKEELEYLKLDKTRKNWWKFKNKKNPFE